jgi:hypothetical protein
MKTSTVIQDNRWITPTIKAIQCLKTDLYLLTKNYNDPKLKNFYKLYHKILSNTITDTKRSYCNRQIFTSKNKIKTAWNIVKAVTGRRFVHEHIHILNTDGNLTNNQQIISNSFNDHFLSIADKTNNKTYNNFNPDRNNSIPIECSLQTLKNPFSDMKYNYTPRKEIENIIKSSKPTNSHAHDDISEMKFLPKHMTHSELEI